MRLFIGMPVPKLLANALVRAAHAIELPTARWTPADNMHLTLVFLGEVAEDRLLAIMRALSELETAPFQVRVTGLDTFPRAGVLFAEIEPAPRLLQLQARVAESMARCGFVLESRPYHPHITLARFRSSLQFNRARSVRIAESKHSFRMEAVNLYRSRPTPDGSRYEILAQAGVLAV